MSFISQMCNILHSYTFFSFRFYMLPPRNNLVVDVVVTLCIKQAYTHCEREQYINFALLPCSYQMNEKRVEFQNNLSKLLSIL